MKVILFFGRALASTTESFKAYEVTTTVLTGPVQGEGVGGQAGVRRERDGNQAEEFTDVYYLLPFVSKCVHSCYGRICALGGRVDAGPLMRELRNVSADPCPASNHSGHDLRGQHVRDLVDLRHPTSPRAAGIYHFPQARRCHLARD
jgi:hypothetical protein